MSQMSHKSALTDPYKDQQFQAFINSIGYFNVRSWTVLADALGVSRRTILRWKKHPLAQSALIGAISGALVGMNEAGKNDWRQHREHLRMLGLKERKISTMITGTRSSMPINITKTDYVLFAERAKLELNERIYREL